MTIGDNVTIGANDVVTKDIPSNTTVVRKLGNPLIINNLCKTQGVNRKERRAA